MPNFRYISRLISAFFTRFKAIIVIGILLGIAIFFTILLVVPFFSSRTTEKIGITGRFSTTNLPNNVLLLIGEGLTKINEAGEVSPGLATSWEASEEGKVWKFTLKDDIFWQDGKEVTTENINYQFSDLEVERPDAKTLIFKLQNPYSPFPSVLSKPVFKKGLLGTGEWSVKRITFSGEFVNEITLQHKNKDKKIFRFYPTEERTKLAFKLGEVNQIVGLIDPKPLETWERLNIVKEVNTGEYVALFLNTQDKLLSEKTVRRALAYGIKKDELGSERAISPISPTSWAYNPQVKPYTYDPEKTKDTIADLPDELREGLTINLSTSPILLKTAEKIAKDWEELGIKTNIQVSSNIPTDFQALLAIFDTPEDPDQYSTWHSTQTASNITKYQSPRIDKLLEDGRTNLDLEQRKRIYIDFQRFLVEDSPAIFLYHPTTYTISRN